MIRISYISANLAILIIKLPLNNIKIGSHAKNMHISCCRLYVHPVHVVAVSLKNSDASGGDAPLV